MICPPPPAHQPSGTPGLPPALGYPPRGKARDANTIFEKFPLSLLFQLPISNVLYIYITDFFCCVFTHISPYFPIFPYSSLIFPSRLEKSRVPFPIFPQRDQRCIFSSFIKHCKTRVVEQTKIQVFWTPHEAFANPSPENGERVSPPLIMID